MKMLRHQIIIISDYYEHFNWIRKFAKEFPKFKIAVKNKKQFYDKKAKSIIEKLAT